MARVAQAAPNVVVRLGDPSPLGLPFSHFSRSSRLRSKPGTPSPAGPAFLDFGAPAGNHHGPIAVTADLTAAAPTDAIFALQ